MRRIAALVILAGVVGLAAFVAPKPTVTDLAGRWFWPTNATVGYAAKVYLSGPLTAKDSLRYTQYRGDTLIVALKTQNTDTTFTWAAPAAGQSVQLRLFARVYRGTTSSGAFQGDSTVVTGPDLPPPVVDSVVITPASATVTAPFLFGVTVYGS